ncbi:hypothetical protein BHE74_00042619 [Ensete ventricosum]|nr:hypothetical protein BHE74_00042619 [Ensete ventricosum]
MEPQHYQQQQQQQLLQEDGNIGSCSSGGGGSKASFLCRQSSTRWIPTSDQIRILRDLYYNNGLRSPNAEQIQRISARLRQYGKIEGKNVFYWFQNHKARERQKKRLTVDITPTTSSSKSSAVVSPGTYCKQKYILPFVHVRAFLISDASLVLHSCRDSYH